MRKALILLLLITSFISLSQTAPPKINYQGVLRSPNGNPMVSRNIGLKLRILQGSASGVQVSAETVNVTTNGLGLFNTVVGTGAGSNVSGINWSNGPYFLEVSVDSTGGTGYLYLGTQELVSVPYALYAQTAASAPPPNLTFNNNMLSAGGNSVQIQSSGSTSIVTTGAMTNQISGNSYTLNVPQVNVSSAINPTLSGQALGLAQVLGSFPNYSVMVAPVIQYNPVVGTLSLSSFPSTSPPYSYTYNITPQLSLFGNTLSVGPPSNSVALITAGSTPITTLAIGAGGTGTISNPATNNFSITIPPTNISGTGVTGSFPNYTINSTAQSVVTVSGTAGASVSVNSNTYNVSVPAVSLTTSGALTQGGAYPSITLNTPSVTVTDSPLSGLAHVGGTFPNYTVAVLPLFNYNPSTGSLVVANSFSPALSYSFNVTPTLSYNNGTLTSGPSTNTVFIPTAAPPAIVGTGAATVSSLANSFTVAVPAPSITQSGGATVSGAYPSFTVNAPAQFNLSTSGGASQIGTYPNITVSAPAQLNLTATNGASVIGTYPNLVVDAPSQLNLLAAGGATVGGTYPNMIVNAPQQLNLTSTGGATVSGTYPNIVVNAPQQVTLTASGGGITSIGGSYPNITLTSPSVVITPSLPLLGTNGLLQKSGTFPNFNLYVAPDISYNSNTGSLTIQSFPLTSPTYSYGYNITPNITISNNVIRSGPTSNTVAVISPAAQAITGLSATGIAVSTTPTQLVGSLAFTKVSATSEIDLYLHCLASSGLFVGASSITYELRIDGNSTAVSSEHAISSSGSTDYITLRAVFSGLAAGNHNISVWAKTNSGLSTLVAIDPPGNGKIILKETY